MTGCGVSHTTPDLTSRRPPRARRGIDQLAARARRQIDRHVLRAVVGHGDWRVEHLRFHNGALTAVYDWDSLSAGPEPVFVGAAAHAFTSDWSIPGHPCVPTTDESLKFIADYEAARGTPFEARERKVALASLIATTAYSARCEHSDNPTKRVPNGFVDKLEREGQRVLEQARP